LNFSARGKSPKVFVLEAESSRRRHNSTTFPEELLLFLNFAHAYPSERRYFTAVKLKDPKPTLIGSGEPKERRRPHGHTISGHDKKLWYPLTAI